MAGMPFGVTTDAIFSVRSYKRNFWQKKRHYFVHLWTPRRYFIGVVWWAFRKLDVEEWLVKGVMEMHANVKTVLKTKHGNSEEFIVKVVSK